MFLIILPHMKFSGIFPGIPEAGCARAIGSVFFCAAGKVYGAGFFYPCFFDFFERPENFPAFFYFCSTGFSGEFFR
jgi:hypothetical protein